MVEMNGASDLAPVVLRVMGVVVHLRATGGRAAELRADLVRAWERCLEETSEAPAATVEICLDDDPDLVVRARARGAVAGTDLFLVMDEVSSSLTQTTLEQVVGTRWLLHACALADTTTGRTVVLVAPSGTGKTTASRTLGQSLGYLTDETAVIALDGSIVPFAKPLSLLVDGKRPKRQVSPAEAGLVVAPPDCTVVAVALLQRESEPTEVRVEDVPMVEGLSILAEQTSSLHLLDRPLHTVANLLNERGGLRRLVYSEAVDLVPVVSSWLRGPDPVAAPALEEVHR
ncbi:ATP-binding protein [Nocardioides daphniae]|nr:ATP-binding protein [Nocardioides daphniae]